MKKILLLSIVSSFILTGCYPTSVDMSLGNMRLITSSASPQDTENFAMKTCKNDFYEALASYLKPAKNIASSV